MTLPFQDSTAPFEVSTAPSADGTQIGWHSVGAGPDLIVVGGVLSTGLDYADLARTLAASYRVHLLDRRGRGLSGPQRDDHSIGDECDDLLAVTAATGASTVFGHSFGGLVALETARRSPVFDEIVLYEPGVPITGFQSTDWLDAYERHLARGDRRGAFASMVKGAGHAPKALSVMPLWYVRAVLHVAIRGAHWRAMEVLLDTNLAEHRIAAALETPDAGRFQGIDAEVLLLGGARSPHNTRDVIHQLHVALAGSEVELLPGLDHLAPARQPAPVASAMLHRGSYAPPNQRPNL